MTRKESLLSPTVIYSMFYDVDVDPYLAWEGELLEMEYEENLQPVSQ